MNGQGIRSIRLLQWVYPLALWLIVAFFTFLACKNVVASARWEPQLPGEPNTPRVLVAAATLSQSASAIRYQ